MMDPTKSAKNPKPWGRYELSYKPVSQMRTSEEGYWNPPSSVRPFSNYQSRSKEYIADGPKLQGRPWSRGKPNLNLRSRDGFSFGEHPNHRSQEQLDHKEQSSHVRPKSSHQTSKRSKEQHLRDKLAGKGVDQYLQVLAWKDSKPPVKMRLRNPQLPKEVSQFSKTGTTGFERETADKRGPLVRSNSNSQQRTQQKSQLRPARMRMERECCKSKRQLLQPSTSAGKQRKLGVSKFTSTSGLLLKIEPSEIDEQRNSVLVRSQPTLIELPREKDTQTSGNNLASLPFGFGRYTGQFIIRPDGVIVKGVRTGDGLSDGNDETHSGIVPLTPKNYSDKNIGTSRVTIKADRPDSPAFGDIRVSNLSPRAASSSRDRGILVQKHVDPYKDYQIDEVLPSNDTEMNLIMLSRSDKSEKKKQSKRNSKRKSKEVEQAKIPSRNPSAKEMHTFRGDFSNVKDVKIAVRQPTDSPDTHDARTPPIARAGSDAGITEVEFQLTKVDPFEDGIEHTIQNSTENQNQSLSPELPLTPLPRSEPQRAPVEVCPLCSTIAPNPVVVLQAPLMCRPPVSPSKGKSKTFPSQGSRVPRNQIKTREGVFEGLVSEPTSLPDKQALSNKEIRRIAFIARTNPRVPPNSEATLAEVYTSIRHRGFKSIDGKAVFSTPKYPDLKLLVQGITTYVLDNIQGPTIPESDDATKEVSWQGVNHTPSRHPSRFSGLNSRNTLVSAMESPRKTTLQLVESEKYASDEPLLSRLGREKQILDQEIRKEVLLEQFKKAFRSLKPQIKGTKTQVGLEEVSNFVENVITAGKILKQVAVIGIILLERASNEIGLALTSDNFKPLLISCWLISSKMWDDEGYETGEFSKMFPAYDRQTLNRLEGLILDALDFDTSVSLGAYTSKYFALHPSFCTAPPEPQHAKAQAPAATPRTFSELQAFSRARVPPSTLHGLRTLQQTQQTAEPSRGPREGLAPAAARSRFGRPGHKHDGRQGWNRVEVGGRVAQLEGGRPRAGSWTR